MKIKLSKSQWEMMGKKAGWIKTAGSANELKSILDIIEKAQNLISQASSLIRQQGKSQQSQQWIQTLDNIWNVELGPVNREIRTVINQASKQPQQQTPQV